MCPRTGRGISVVVSYTEGRRSCLPQYHAGILITLYKQTLLCSYQATSTLKAENVSAKAPSSCAMELAGKRTAGVASRAAELRPMCADWTAFHSLLTVEAPVHNSGRGFKDGTALLDDSMLPGSLASPERIVEATLGSESETRKLARHLFEAYATPVQPSDDQDDKDTAGNSKRTAAGVVTLASIESLFSSKAAAQKAFAVLDRNENGECELEEMTAACLDIHNERACVLMSMHDVDSAVAKLDDMLSGLVFTASLVIVAALLSSHVSTLIASLGTIMLGLSWLVSKTAQDSLSSLVWVFCKHPLDVGDVVVIPQLLSKASTSTTRDPTAALQGYNDGDTFVVEEMMLLSTRLRATTTGKSLAVSNTILDGIPIVNLRRSGPISEPWQLDVAFNTPFEKVEALRVAMAAWVELERNHFRPGIDVVIGGLTDQSRLSLTLEIRYRSNWQDTALRLRRRNRWLSALKHLLKVHGIGGPGTVPPKSSDVPSDNQLDDRPGNDKIIPRYDLMDTPQHRADIDQADDQSSNVYHNAADRDDDHACSKSEKRTDAGCHGERWKMSRFHDVLSARRWRHGSSPARNWFPGQQSGTTLSFANRPAQKQDSEIARRGEHQAEDNASSSVSSRDDVELGRLA